MNSKVSCMNRERFAEKLNCNNCGFNKKFELSEFGQMPNLIQKISEVIHNSVERAWDIEKIRFFLTLIIHEGVPNSVEHGILGINSEEKKALLKDPNNDYYFHIAKRWAEKKSPIGVSVCINNERILLGFHDNGKGHDPSLHSLEPLREDDVLEPSGKGLRLLYSMGVKLHWNEKGNSLLCAVADEMLRGEKACEEHGGIICIGVERFDRQHHEMFSIVNELLISMAKLKEKESFVEIFNKLIAHLKNHFSEEEELLAEHEYPDLKDHQDEHESIIQKVEGLRDAVHKGDKHLNSEILGFLIGWKKKHISKTDMNYAEFLKAKGLA